jgi:hypothetical protein
MTSEPELMGGSVDPARPMGATTHALKMANRPGLEWLSSSPPRSGMLIALFSEMPLAKQLTDEINEFARRKPGHESSVNALLAAVGRIDSQFSGETRELLLIQARETFLQQIRILETKERTRETLETLQTNQKALVDALKKLAGRPSEDVTLH